MLAPDVVLRTDPAAAPPGAPQEVRGTPAVAERSLAFAGRARAARPALVDGHAGVVVAPRGRLAVVLRMRVEGGRIVALEVVADPARLRRLAIAALDD